MSWLHQEHRFPPIEFDSDGVHFKAQLTIPASDPDALRYIPNDEWRWEITWDMGTSVQTLVAINPELTVTMKPREDIHD